MPDSMLGGNASEVNRMEIAGYIAAADQNFSMERYRPFRHYDIVVFVKAFDKESIELARSLQGSGVKVIFDINVNYYERWGDYSRDPRTMPTDEQMGNCKTMTELADLVVARSSYLENQCREYNSNVVVITDAVNTELYRPFCLGRGL